MKINAVEIPSLFNMCGVSLKDRYRNSDVRERCGWKEHVVTRVENESDDNIETDETEIEEEEIVKPRNQEEEEKEEEEEQRTENQPCHKRRKMAHSLPDPNEPSTSKTPSPK
ncbi:hypothetical protein EVAR_28204_1 [Eumeta japonica]|uniref:Uncharacterized protein n=1 Tax=Eumeta variegata TaxID=151549 RepID=A0A4C1VJE1_EUMVA|nr:hypothetical protein EVAR_28204_1 [Eumeta japonica]